jgi:hypothetical protein
VGDIRYIAEFSLGGGCRRRSPRSSLITASWVLRRLSLVSWVCKFLWKIVHVSRSTLGGGGLLDLKSKDRGAKATYLKPLDTRSISLVAFRVAECRRSTDDCSPRWIVLSSTNCFVLLHHNEPSAANSTPFARSGFDLGRT